MGKTSTELNRRDAIVAGLGVLSALVLPGCRSEPPQPKEHSTRGQTSGEQNIGKIVEGLPSFDPAVGSKVNEVRVPGAEKLLIVVRYSHVNEKALSVAGPEAKTALLAAAPQVEKMLAELARHTKVNSITGDGLLPDVAESRNKAISYLTSTTRSLENLVQFKNSKEVLTAADAIVKASTSTPEIRQQAEALRIAVESDPARFDRVLGQYHQTKSALDSEARFEPVIKVARDLGLKLSSVEDPVLHERAYDAAVNGGGTDFDDLSELREDAILEAVSKSGAPVTVIAMGAIHRFGENATKREKLPPAARVSVVEYNPSAFPDGVAEFRELMNK